LQSSDHHALEAFVKTRQSQMATDKEGQYVYLAETRWSLEREIRENPKIEFLSTSEVHP